jgi:hypothetical protein
MVELVDTARLDRADKVLQEMASCEFESRCGHA